MVSIQFYYFNFIAAALTCELYIDGVLINTTNGTLQVVAAGVRTFKIIPTNPLYPQKEFTIDIASQDLLYQWDIQFFVATHGTVGFTNLIAFKDTCTNRTQLSFNGVMNGAVSVDWYIGSNLVGSGLDVVIDTNYTDIIRAIYTDSFNTETILYRVNKRSGVANLSMAVYCDPEIVARVADSEEPCLSCADNPMCNCSQAANCNCIKVGQEIVIATKIDFVDGCEEDTIVEFYVDEVLIETQTIAIVTDVLTDVTLEFETEGLHVIEVKSTNCCGTCTVSKEIVVGGYVSVKNISCNLFSIKHYLNYPDVSSGKLVLKDVEGTTVLTVVKTPFVFEEFIITTPKDGVFIATLSFLNSDGTVLYAYDFLLINLCKVKTCYEKLINSIMCKDCSKCSDIVNPNDICLFTTFYTTLLVKIDKIQTNHSNSFYSLGEEILSQISADLVTIDDLVNVLSKLCLDCNNE